jgi:hypothetical protein
MAVKHPRVRRIYWDQLERGIAGDDAALIARDAAAAIELAELIARQPAHNAPAPVEQMLPEDLHEYVDV